ncbi:LysR family transcriptional regulator [Acinetobacter nosocomialis]|uniref:LysR family transcriptional regulator n=1 Tax=Acinetobacter nosocomialis TaxID=106654 RepID=UPI00270EC5C5|nr:LysR family transcriptional regulator [Acinetobacter nosocomialis]MDO7192585.1 LysR family transcriptional regulator [Acinetobacter nosocomialis]
MLTSATLTQINIFVKIAESGSLSAAAKELHLTPSAISKNLSQLEERLGVLLIKRTTRSLVLTDIGKAFLEKSHALIVDAEETMNAIRQFSLPTGVLRISCPVSFGCSHIVPLINSYRKKYPDVQCDIFLDDHCINLNEEDIDIAFRITSKSDWTYAARKIADINWIYCASPEYITQQNTNLREPRDLYQYDCLVNPSMLIEGGWSFKIDEHHQIINIKSKIASNSSILLKEAAINHQGIACLPTYIAYSDICSHKLERVLPAYKCGKTHTLYVMYYPSKFNNPLIRTFIDFSCKHFGNTPYWDQSIIDEKILQF